MMDVLVLEVVELDNDGGSPRFGSRQYMFSIELPKGRRLTTKL